MILNLAENHSPRPYQLPLWQAFDRGFKRIFALWHRRAGKDITLWNLAIREAIQTPGLYYYLFPTFTQARKVIWDGMTNDGTRFIDLLPKQLTNTNSVELKVTFWNGSILQLIGTDNYDSIRGTNPRGCIFSEYAYQSPLAWEVIKPILTVNGGWAIFNTTPNGKNHAYKLFSMAHDSEDWWTEKLDINATSVLTEDDMNRERKEGMSEEMIQQEYYCSFEVGSLGAFYASLVQDVYKSLRYCAIPVENLQTVSVFFDLGKTDSTTLGFVQEVGKEVRIIEAYDNNGKDIAHYVKVLRSKPYIYHKLYLPHDAFAKRLESASTIAEQFQQAGFEVERVPEISILNGIQLVRKMFPRLWFAKGKTEALIEALENYQKEFDDVRKVFRENPRHDWSSHYADMIRYLAVITEGIKPTTPEEYKRAQREYIAQIALQPTKKDHLAELDAQITAVLKDERPLTTISQNNLSDPW